MNIGIIGCGKIVRFRHAPECKKNPDIAIAGFYDLNPDRAKELSEEYGGKAYVSVEEMLSDKNVDGVIVCTANRTHAPITIQALKAGKHVLCEKPMATTLEEAVDMQRTAVGQGKLLMIAQNQRFDPVNRKAKSLLRQGEIGKVIRFKTEFSHGGPENWSIDGAASWFFNAKEAFVGAMGDLGVHKIDLIRWFLEEDITSVSAILANTDKKDASGNPVGIDDNSVCLVETRSGVLGTIAASWSNYAVCENSAVLYGTKGVMVVSPAYSDYDIKVINADGEAVYSIPEQEGSGIADAFVDAVIHQKSSPVDGAEGVAGMKVVLAALESSRTGEKIEID